MQDPKLLKIVGQSPTAARIQAAMEAHLAEHLGFEYRRQIEEQLGVPLPNPEEVLPKDVEAQLSPLIARAAQQLLQKNQAEEQQAKNQEQQQDPLVQMQQKELQIKEAESQAKAQKMMADNQIDQERLVVERERIASQERIAGAQLGAKAMSDKEKLEASQLVEGVKIGTKAMSDERNRENKLETITRGVKQNTPNKPTKEEK
jgi:hypothetical protein